MAAVLFRRVQLSLDNCCPGSGVALNPHGSVSLPFIRLGLPCPEMTLPPVTQVLSGNIHRVQGNAEISQGSALLCTVLI